MPTTAESSSDRDPLDRLAEEFVARFRAGERPSVEEFAARLPDRADEVRDLFSALIEMEQLKPVTGDRTGDFAPATEPMDPSRVGEFRVLRRVGVGGMGVVYEAVQESLGRHVALKLMPPEALLDPKRLERFRREAKSAARLHHTNIVPVFGVGEADGRHFYAMQFISGHPLDAVIDEVRRLKGKPQAIPNAPRAASEMAAALVTGSFARIAAPVAPAAPFNPGSELASPEVAPALSGSLSGGGASYWATVARVGAQVADALAHAHGQGVLHRDIKPANLLLDLNGTVWVTDFGLAKSADADDLTHAGDIVGTLRYMAPERFDGAGDHRADIYALGLTLYELLTLTPAFTAENRAKLVQEVTAANPRRPRAIDPAIPRDLETVVLKCVARDPALRYQSAADLADDLRRFTEDRPIRARRASSAELAFRWCRRNPTVASLLTAVVLVFAVGSVVAWYFAAKAEGQEAAAHQERLRARGARQLAEWEQAKAAEEGRKAGAARDEAENLLYAGRVYQANIAAGEYRTSRLLQLLDEARPKPGETDRRGWEWHYLKRLTRTWDADVRLSVPAGVTEQIFQYTFSPDRARVAVTSGNGFSTAVHPVGVYETATGKLVSDLAGLSREIKPQSPGSGFGGTTFGPDLAFASVVDRVEVVEDIPPGFVGPPQEKTRSRVRLFDVRGAEPGPPETVFSEADAYPSVFVAAGGNRVVISASPVGPEPPHGFKSFVEVWDRRAGTPRRTRFQLASADASIVAVSPDGLFAVVSGVDPLEGGKADAPVRGGDLWSLGDKPVRVKRLVSDSAGNTNWFPLAAFSPNGRVLAVPEPGGAVGVFDVRTGARLGRWPVPRDVAATFPRDLSVSDDGRRLTCGGKGGALVTAERVGNLIGFSAPGAPVPPDRDPGGVWRTTAFRQPQRGSDLGEPVGTGATLSADGRRLFAPSGSDLRQWDLTQTGFGATWPEVLYLGGRTAPAMPAHRGRSLLYSTAFGGGQFQEQKFHFRVLDPQQSTSARDFDAVGQNVSAAISPDGHRVLLTNYGAKLRWSLRAAEAPEKELADGGTLARFSDDGRWLYPDDRYFIFNTGTSGTLRSVWVRRVGDGRVACDVPVPPGEVLAGVWVTRAGMLLLATRPNSDPKGEREPDPIALTFRSHDIETGAASGTWTSPAVWAWRKGFFGPNAWALPPPRVFYSADGSKVGVADTGTDGVVRVWLLNGGTGALEVEFRATAVAKTGAPVNPLAWGMGSIGAFEPDGRVSVWTGSDLVTWARPGAAPVRLTGHQYVAAVAFTADGRRAFTLDAPFGAAEAALRAWDPSSGRELLTIRFPMQEQATGIFSPTTDMWLEGERLHVLTMHGVRVFDGTPLTEGK